MILHFSRHRKPTTPNDLSPVEQAQITLAGSLYDGEDLPISRRLAPPAEGATLDESSFFSLIDGWDICEEGQLRYTAWLYCADSGTIFEAGTTTVVAEVIQFYLDNCRDDAIREDLQEAVDRYKSSNPRPWPGIAASRPVNQGR
jgi:hypothetical protein